MERYAAELEQCLQFLSSDRALQDLEMDCYWPKWNAPWWQMSLLHEMKLTHLIPEITVQMLVESLNRIPLKTFPFQSSEIPAGISPAQLPCHCHLGNAYQLLTIWGVDVDRELPWMRPWLLDYQMQDGGLSCDGAAYLLKNEIASSMVATIPPFESILLHTSRPWTKQEKNFIDRAAQFLIGRKLTEGSSSEHNAEERKSALNWQQLCFPRFYFYDILRGLTVLLKWSKMTGGHIPPEAIGHAVSLIEKKLQNGNLHTERLSYEGRGTRVPSSDGQWSRSNHAATFPLLERVSAIGETSEILTHEWQNARILLAEV